MAVSIEGVKVTLLRMEVENNELKLSGKYNVMGSNGAVFATTNFGNGYGDTQVNFNIEARAKINQALVEAEKEINKILGII